jgi:hypothetical protein
MTGPDANPKKKNNAASYVFKIIVNGIIFLSYSNLTFAGRNFGK